MRNRVTDWKISDMKRHRERPLTRWKSEIKDDIIKTVKALSWQREGYINRCDDDR